MTTEPNAPRLRPHRPRNLAAPALVLGLASGLAGCARDRAAITPTTTGTDLSRLPRGRMTPQPFPGSSLAEGRTPPDAPILTAGSPEAVLR